jgi:hypothetical protein
VCARDRGETRGIEIEMAVYTRISLRLMTPNDSSQIGRLILIVNRPRDLVALRLCSDPRDVDGA